MDELNQSYKYRHEDFILNPISENVANSFGIRLFFSRMKLLFIFRSFALTEKEFK